ncbi:hypothetical protein [Pseudomonas aeruginosa]|uniref:hypothetical protein n=1 Tax=Pseudomonas aeruginosa TaxID=287 RepID=UPI000F538BA7|nr:hypothetical protein [Pseudomonas aeruginosa]RQE49382.1 hypothetical protein IPC308_13000 [Pseudomonas aeruginosa]
MKITNVEWNEGAPKKIQPGMLIDRWDGEIELIGTARQMFLRTSIKRWAWLIQPHELQWLAAMANKHKARARG